MTPEQVDLSPSQLLSPLIARARSLEGQIAELVSSPDQSDSQISALTLAGRLLKASVIRPLGEVIAHQQPAHDPGDSPNAGAGAALKAPQASFGVIEGELWAMAGDVAAVLARGVPDLRIKEAAAAVQRMACEFAAIDGSDRREALLGELKAMQSASPAGIQVQSNGPYLVTNCENLSSWLGESIPLPPLTALCRCGQSASKPFCDGTHAEIGFTDEKDPKRVPDRRDSYPGQQVTILDNRGICAHSGFCTDRLSTVFHVGAEPFVTPSGARMDDIVRAVRACPSGALSFAIENREAREQVDQSRPSAIEVSKDGPYRVTGGLPLSDAEGNPEPINQGASREHLSLCRCGHSQNKPFCSGMHWYVKFFDPPPSPDPTLFEWAGGLPALTRMTRIFYSKYVPEDPLVGPLFANMAPDHPERVAAWLGEVFGGPKSYSGRYGGYTRMLSQHLGKGLTEAQRARWVSLISRSAEDAGLPADAEFRAAFTAYIEWGSRLALENSQPGAKPPMHMPMPRWWWVCDAKPGARMSALAPATEVEPPIVIPGPGEPVNFTHHVRPLFRKMDRESMSFVFDLWAFKDVSTHASEILKRLENGSMPCDGAWPREKVELFRRWVDSGMIEG